MYAMPRLLIHVWNLYTITMIFTPVILSLLMFQQFYFYNRRSDPLVYLSVYGFVLTMFSIGLAIGVIIAVGMLFYIQVLYT